jgi:hypothetical protein
MKATGTADQQTSTHIATKIRRGSWSTNAAYKAVRDGAGFIPFDIMTYNIFDKLCSDPAPEFRTWDLYGTSNGAFYFVPCWSRAKLRMESPNGYTASVSPEAAGITATLFALDQLSGGYRDNPGSSYKALLEYVLYHHPEAQEIRELID